MVTSSRDRTDLLGGVLACVAVVTAVLTLTVPDVLRGAPVMNGSARGTAVGVLVAAVVLVIGIRTARRRTPWAGFLRLGATWYLIYNGVLFAFATPYNRLFLGYVATLGLAIFASAVQVHRLAAGDPPAVPPRARWVSAYVLVIAVLNILLWLGRVAPGTVRGDYGLLRGTGLTTNPVIVEDLAFWLPLAVVVGLSLRSGSALGGQLAGALLVFWVLESVGVATDQWLGHRADPSSSVATLGAVYLFVGLALVGVAVLVFYVRAYAASTGSLPRPQEPVPGLDFGGHHPVR